VETDLPTNYQALIQYPEFTFAAFQKEVEALGPFEKIKEGFERYNQNLKAERGQEKREIQAERVLMKEWLSTATSELSLLNNRYSLPGQTANRTLQQIHQLSFTWVLTWAFSSGANYMLKLNSASGLPDQQSDMLNAWVTRDFCLTESLASYGRPNLICWTQIHPSPRPAGSILQRPAGTIPSSAPSYSVSFIVYKTFITNGNAKNKLRK
jgi:hypothetical protein